jgi:hypothetical protein
MSGLRWDEEMKFELFRLRSELRSENFRVLANPLGLGTIQVSRERSDRPLYPPMRVPLPLQMPDPLKDQNQQGRRAKPVEVFPWEQLRGDKSQKLLVPEEPMPQLPLDSFERGPTLATGDGHSMSKRAVRWALVHFLDLSFVLLCLTLGLIALGFILDPQHMSWTPEHLAQAIPLQVLSHLQPWMLLIAVYLIFGLYWLFFKTVSGSTLGESCLPKVLGSPKDLAAAPGKRSTET